ncbi:sialidase family protein, partial [Pseudopedobacter sp.]|uniref:sialidase family protein n=1 Tax=Pseudopedobacter sp. TaxID=1936787 RepID=UPI00333EF645
MKKCLKITGAYLLLFICVMGSPRHLMAQNDADLMNLPGEGNSLSTKKNIVNKKYSTADLLNLALLPAKVKVSPLPEYDVDKLDYALSEGITRTPAGTLWTCWVAGGDNDKAFVVLASSRDNGQTWSKPRVVIDPRISGLPLGRRALVANVWTDPKGNLWLFYDQSIGYFDGRAGVWATVCSNPDSKELKWSKPKRISDGAALNKPIVTAKGEWLLPVSLWPRTLINSEFKAHFHELDDRRGANVLVSIDQGKTWKLRGNTVKSPYPTVDENMLIERKDGSLWMTMRTLKGMCESFSTDRGYTWSKAEESKIFHGNSRHFITRLKSGRLLLIKHGEQIKRPEGDSTVLSRTKLTAFLSEDDGITWSKGFLLVDRGVSYPDGIQAEDGTIYICYDYDRWFSAEIWMARFTEKDILVGKMLDPHSNKAILISKATGLTEEERAIRIEHRRKKAE